MQKRAYHVVSNPNGGWAVKREGAERASRRFETMEDALTYARSMSRGEGADLVCIYRRHDPKRIHIVRSHPRGVNDHRRNP